MQWVAVFLMGVVLGALGGGGGILTVPILVGFFGMTAIEASGGSLLVVGLASSIGAIEGLFRRTVEPRAALLIAIPSSAGALVARKFVVPSIPVTVMGIPRDDLLLGAFALVMIYVGFRMIAPTKGGAPARAEWPQIVGVGLLIGIVSGILGAGGGFLILPALTLLLGVELSRAIPTSLLIICMQSLIGFTGELGKPIQWSVLISVMAVAMAGMIAGLLVRSHTPKRSLQISFSVLVFLVAIWMVGRIIMNHLG